MLLVLMGFSAMANNVPVWLSHVSRACTALSKHGVGVEPPFWPDFWDCGRACARGGGYHKKGGVIRDTVMPKTDGHSDSVQKQRHSFAAVRVRATTKVWAPRGGTRKAGPTQAARLWRAVGSLTHSTKVHAEPREGDLASARTFLRGGSAEHPNPTPPPSGFQTTITMRKRKQRRIVALGSLLRSLEVDFFAIQEPHFVTVEDRQAGMQCLSKYGYGLDRPLHEEGRGGVALAWKTSKWTLQSMKFLSPRALKASLSSGPLEITLVVAHLHHKHTRRQSQWKDIAKELHGPNLILCADHNSLVVKHRDAFAPPEFEHDTSLRAREQEVTTLAKAGLRDVWVDIHCPTLTDIKDKESSCPTGFTYGYPREGERLDPQRVRRIDRIHTTPDLLSLATSVYPMFAANSDHKAILAEFTPPSFETEDTVPRFYCPEAILQDSEAMEDLETSLKSITSTGDQWWEDALGCIQKKAVSYQREHKNKKQSVELQALRLLRGSTRDSVTPAVYQFLSSLGIAASEAATAYTLLVGVYEKAQRDKTGMETLSKLKGVITSGETSGDLRTRRNELYRLMRELHERKKLQQLVSRAGTAVRGAKAVAKELVEHWDQVSTPTGATEEECVAYLKALGVEQRLRKAGRLLFKQLSLDIVHEGLKRLNSNSSPGLDGFSAKFFKRFSEIFEPQMYPPPPLYKLRPCPSYRRRRDRNNCVRNLITYKM